MKSVQIRSFFWLVFGHFSRSVCNQKTQIANVYFSTMIKVLSSILRIYPNSWSIHYQMSQAIFWKNMINLCLVQNSHRNWGKRSYDRKINKSKLLHYCRYWERILGLITSLIFISEELPWGITKGELDHMIT